MPRKHLDTRIDAKVLRAVERICEARNLRMDRFIEDALLDKLAEFGDIGNLRQISCEPSRPIEELLKDLDLPSL